MFPTSASNAPSATWTSKSFLSSRPSAMTELMAVSIARSATGNGARASAETEADSVAVAAKEAGTKSNQKTIPILGVVFICINNSSLYTIDMARNSKRIIFSIAIVGLLFSMYFFLSAKKTSRPPEAPAANNQPVQTEKEEVKAEETQAEETKNIPGEKTESQAPEIPAKFLLQIPFYSQAPFSNWDKVHEEMCEEASVLNAGLYLLGEKPSKDAFEKELMNFKKLEEKELGDYKSNTIAEIKKAADIYFAGKISSKIIDNPTLIDIETDIAAGHPVVVPLAGRDIGNPNFTPPGPVYHILVVKGYDAQNFITNDVGTRKGDSYTYKKNIIMQNMHDWNPQDIHLGAKRVLILLKNS